MRLASRLSALLPGDLDRVFFSDSGSVAVEVALKMAVQYWLNKGVRGRTKMLAFRGAYHGDTFATMAICDPDEGMHKHFREFYRNRSLPIYRAMKTRWRLSMR